MKDLKRLLKQAELDENDVSYEALAKELIKRGYGLDFIEEKYIVKTYSDESLRKQWLYDINKKGWAKSRFQKQVEHGSGRYSRIDEAKLIKVGYVLLETLEGWKKP